jgi:hypothetical protein
MYVALTVPVVYRHHAAFVDSEHACQPFGNGDFQIILLNFRDAAGALDQLFAASFEWDS